MPGWCPAIFAFITPKPQLGSFTNAIHRCWLDNALLALRKYSRVLRHRRAIHRLLRSQLRRFGFGVRTRREPGTAVRTYHLGSPATLEIGTFYFGGIRNFLLWSDTK